MSVSASIRTTPTRPDGSVVFRHGSDGVAAALDIPSGFSCVRWWSCVEEDVVGEERGSRRDSS